MKTRIFYFSGTGNSYWIARTLGEKLNGTVELCGLQSVPDFEAGGAHRIGFVVPVYFATIPDFVRNAIGKISLEKDSYIFGIVNCGAMAGNALFDLKQTIKIRGGQLGAGYTLFMPDNSIMFKTAESRNRQMLTTCAVTIDAIAADVNCCIKNDQNLKVRKRYRLLGSVTKPGLLTVLGGAQNSAGNTCNGCGKCAVFCPVENITIENGKPAFGSRCTHCFGCGHWCPNRAIRFGVCKVNDASKWTHPEVTMEELAGYNRRVGTAIPTR